MPILSWITGWVNCSGWVALVATGGLLGSQLVLGVISLMNPVGTVLWMISELPQPLTTVYHQDYEAQRWHQFLIYVGYNLVAFAINSLMNRILPLFNKAACEFSLCSEVSRLVPR